LAILTKRRSSRAPARWYRRRFTASRRFESPADELAGRIVAGEMPSGRDARLQCNGREPLPQGCAPRARCRRHERSIRQRPSTIRNQALPRHSGSCSWRKDQVSAKAGQLRTSFLQGVIDSSSSRDSFWSIRFSAERATRSTS
jgi:hypothetical protein